MTSLNLNDFLNEHPELRPLIFKTEGETSKWGRVVCKWHERQTDHEHIFTPLINLQNGDIYLDCSKKKIYAKFITHTILRPFFIAFKTFYHLALPISIPHIIYKTIEAEGNKRVRQSQKQVALQCLKNSAKSIADIVRTPLYGTIMTIVNIAAVIIGPFAPKMLYDFREMSGKLISSLNRDPDAFDIFECFQPFLQLQHSNRRMNRKRLDTNYTPQMTDYEIGLSNFARAQIHFRRNHYTFFNGELDPKIRFESPSYGDVLKAQQLEAL